MEEKIKDVRSLLLSQASLTEHQTKLMIKGAASTAASKTALSSSTNQNLSSKEVLKLQKERSREALEALEKSERVIVDTVEISLKEHEDRLTNTLLLHSAFVAVLTPLLVYAINRML